MKHFRIACFFLVLVAGGRSWGSVPSGTSSPLRTDFQETLWRYAASAGSNPSFLSGMECGRISYLQAEGSYGSGKLVNYYQSDSRLGGLYNPQIQISAESETKRSIFREKDKTKRSKKESAQHSKSRNKSFVMTSVSAL